MIAAARGVVLVATLGGLAGAADGGLRGMMGGDAIAAAGWCAIVAGAIAGLGWAVAGGLSRAWAAEGSALARARAWLTTGALGVWAAGLVVLGDRFAVRFSALDLAAMLWAVIGVAVAAWLGLVVEPVARRIAARPRRPSAAMTPRGAARVLVPALLALAIIGASVAAIVRGRPADPESLGAMAARGLGAR